MPRVVWSRAAGFDLVRLTSFLAPKSERAASRALRSIYQGVKPLAKHPEMGRVVKDERPDIREWVVEFGRGAYIVRYEFNRKTVTILGVRHGREVGF